MGMEDLTTRGVKAAERYLQVRGYEVLETVREGSADVIVADDNEEIVFANVTVRADFGSGFPVGSVSPEKISRMEMIAARWLRDCDHPEGRVRFDEISILAVSEDRALVRHHLNVFSG